MNNTSTVIKQFTKLRKMRGLSVREISEITGVSGSSISSYETGRRSPNLITLEKLVAAVGGKGLTITGWE